MAQHKTDFDEAIEKFFVYKDHRANYQLAADAILETLEEIEVIGDTTGEGEVGNITGVIKFVHSMIIGVLLVAVLVALVMSTLIIGTVRKLLGADPTELADVSAQMALGQFDINTTGSATGGVGFN
ncbi:MAG: hypothetical protein V7721_09970 [Porticoccaceae bacterium]